MHVVWPVRGMQQAMKQARRPFNNVLGLVRGKCFASSPSLSLLEFFISSVEYYSVFFPHAFCGSTVTTNSDAAVTFHFLTNCSWLNEVSNIEPGRKGVVCTQFLL